MRRVARDAGVVVAMRWRATTLALLLAATAHAVDDGLARRLGDLRASSAPDSVETIVAERLPAAQAHADSAELQVLLLERGMTRVAYGRAADGEGDLRAALAIAEARHDTPASLRARRYLGEACQHLGRREDSAREFTDLLARARAAGDDFHAGKALYGLGRLRYRARDLAGADSLYSLALPLLTAAADSADLAALHNGLGTCRAGRGRYREAATQFARAAVMARGGRSSSLEAMATNNLAGIETILGDPGAAADGYRRARDIQRDLGLWQQVGTPWRNLAQALTEAGRLDDARVELTAALAFCRERGFRDEVATTLVRLAEVDLAAGRAEAALVALREVLALAPPPELEACATARMRAADALLRLDREAEALAELDAAADLLRGRDDFNLEMMLAAARGSALRHLGRHADALAALRPALARADASGVARYRLPLLVSAADCWVVLGQPDSARVCLAAAQAGWEEERSLPADPEWRERRGADAQQLFALLIGLDLDDGDVPGAFASAQRYKARTLRERLLGPGEALATSGELPPPVDLAGLRHDVLRAGEVVVDVVVGADRGWAFVVSRDTCVVHQLPGEADLDGVFAPLLDALTSPFGTYAPEHATAARAALLGADGAASSLVAAATTVFACADGGVHRLPLALVLGVDDVRHVPSATLLAHLRAHGAPLTAPARVLAVAGRENADRRRLAGALAEVADLKRRYRHVTLPVDGAAAFGGLDPAAFDVLHLASHAQINPQRPWNSALVFGEDSDPVLVHAADVVGHDLAARLAFLSSCESAGGAVLAGEGVVGLASAFLAAGVPTVVATLWPVDDATTRRFVTAFYADLATGRPPAAALAAAREMVRCDPATRHPFYWAGFVVLGEGGEPVPLAERRSWLPWLVGLAAVGAAGAWWLARRRAS